jgi:hypothetical protein
MGRFDIHVPQSGDANAPAIEVVPEVPRERTDSDSDCAPVSKMSDEEKKDRLVLGIMLSGVVDGWRSEIDGSKKMTGEHIRTVEAVETADDCLADLEEFFV